MFETLSLDVTAVFVSNNWITLLLISCFMGLLGATLIPWLVGRSIPSSSPQVHLKQSINTDKKEIEHQLHHINRRTEEEEEDESAERSDPVQEYMDGERQNLPFVCPFMDAFKKAKQAADAEKDEASANVAQLKEATVSLPPENVLRLRKTLDEGKEQQTSREGDVCDVPLTDTEELIRKTKESRCPEEVTAFYQHIPSHVKQLEQKKMFQSLNETELVAEGEARTRQLADIYKLMQTNNDTFGLNSLDEIQDQMRLYVR